MPLSLTRNVLKDEVTIFIGYRRYTRFLFINDRLIHRFYVNLYYNVKPKLFDF
jgi:hypothetical protein